MAVGLLPVALLLFISLVLAGPTGAEGTTCNVKDYGAKGDGKANDTDAFVKAFQACHSTRRWMDTPSADYNTVLVSDGKFLVWPLTVSSEECSDVIFSVAGEMSAPPKPSSWTNDKSYLLFEDCKNFEINGGESKSGEINGQGSEWWATKKDDERPKLIIISKSENVIVRDIYLHDSPMFHLVPSESSNILIEGLTIEAPSSSPNTDGIDPSSCHNITIRNCMISTGDDNVALKPGTSDVLVENCTFKSGHGCSIGSINKTGVVNVVVRNITFEGTENAVRIKTWQGGSGSVENITYTDIKFLSVGLPLDIDMYYCPHSHCKNSSKGVTIKNIVFSNMSGTQTSEVAGQLLCSDSVPCTDIELKDIDIEPSKGSKNKFICWKAYGKSDNVHPDSCLKSG